MTITLGGAGALGLLMALHRLAEDEDGERVSTIEDD